MVISASWPVDLMEKSSGTTGLGKQQIRTMNVTVPFKNPADSYDSATKQKLVYLMTLLYHVYIHPEEKSFDFQKLNLASIHDLDGPVLNDDSMFAHSIVALGCGKFKKDLLPNGENSNAFQKSQFFSYWVAVEMMRRGRSLRPGLFQDLIQQHLRVWQAPRAVSNVLCKFRIAASRERTRLQDINEVNTRILTGWDLAEKRYWLPFITYDNLGFRILGARAGYDQYVMILVGFISVLDLKRVGFYTQPGQPSLSRVRLNWADVRHHFKREDILPKEGDYTILGTQVYALIDSLMKICNRIPFVSTARQLLADGDQFEADTRLCTSYGTRWRIDHCKETTSALEVEQEEEENPYDDVIQAKKPTMYDRPDQQIEVDLPMKADLNKTETVKGLAKGALEMRDRFLAQDGGDTTTDTDEKPVLEDLGIATGGDGAPSNTFILEERLNPEEYKDIQNFAGGFHNLLNLLQKNGHRFAKTHLWDYLEPFRNSDKKKYWFLFPGDPGQTLHELPEMIGAHYVSAIRELSLIRRGEAISPVEVHDHMLERALEHDHCMIVLMWLHVVAISDIIRDSERESDPELYHTGARLAMLIYAKTGAPKYLRMSVYFYVWWQVSSTADKILYENFFFTKKTADGKTVFFDRFEEWFNRDIREYLGKYKRPNQELLCIRTSLLMKDRKRVRAGSGLRSNEVESDFTDLEKTLAITPIFCSQLDLIESWNLWGSGPVLVGKKGREIEPTRFTDPTNRTPLNFEILFEISAAQDTLMEYFEETQLKGPLDKIGESEKKVSLVMKPVELAAHEEKINEELIRLTSTDARNLEQVATVAFLKDRLHLLADEFEFLPSSDEIPTSGKKEVFTKLLARFHKRILKDDPQFRDDIKAELDEKAAACSGFADRERKKSELQLQFFSFTNDARAKFAAEKYVIEIEPPDANNDGSSQETPTRPTVLDEPPGSTVIRRRNDRITM
jgi:hypothetical protein